ncbi:hypothetical protein BDK51DRAFT_13671, partial [Blyttiomyces helicus]
PPSIHYIPDFITEAEAARLLVKVNAAPKPRWTTLRNRRLQNWGARVVSEKPGSAAIAETMPEWLDAVGKKIASLGVFADPTTPTPLHPNQCLINEYHPGQGILPHEDGPAYLPVVATISLGGSCNLDFFRHRAETQSDGPDFSLHLRPNSLLILRDTAYTSFLHGIAEREVDLVGRDQVLNWEEAGLGVEEGEVEMGREATRVSLTFRVVLKVKSL